MGGGVFALQQAELGQDAGSRTDGGHLFARLGKGRAGVGHGLVGRQVRGAGDAARQHHQIHIGVIHFFGQCIGGQADVVAADQLFAAHGGSHDHLHLGAAEQVHHQQGFTFFGPIGKKDDCFAHVQILLSGQAACAACGCVPPACFARQVRRHNEKRTAGRGCFPVPAVRGAIILLRPVPPFLPAGGAARCPPG